MTIEPSAFRHQPGEQPRVRDLGDGRFVLDNTYGSSYEYFPGRPMPVPAAVESADHDATNCRAAGHDR